MITVWILLVLMYIIVQALISSLRNSNKLSKSLAHNSFKLEISSSISSFGNRTEFLIGKQPFSYLITSQTLKKTFIFLTSNKLNLRHPSYLNLVQVILTQNILTLPLEIVHGGQFGYKCIYCIDIEMLLIVEIVFEVLL